LKNPKLKLGERKKLEQKATQKRVSEKELLGAQESESLLFAAVNG
jgi:hypothetical protein